ncbi:MAG: hypothetical protein KDA32_04550 [Phycisphaerales bacterium]|nr:hypothetical protein [Phycisphaerales bacterium]
MTPIQQSHRSAITRVALLLCLFPGCANLNKAGNPSGESAPEWGGGNSPSTAAPSTGVAPKPGTDDLWGIQCLTLTGERRRKLAQAYADSLRKAQGIKPDRVQVYDDGPETSVYYGQYKRVPEKGSDAEAFEPNPRGDLAIVRDLSYINESAGQPVWPFRAATIRPLPVTSRGPKEWRLENAAGYWTLQVAVFFNVEQMRERRYAAEEYCRLLREDGVEAYYHHGVVNSAVFVGTFPKDAIQTRQEKNSFTGVSTAHSRIVDPDMLGLQEKYPYNLQNGAVVYDLVPDPSTGGKRRDPHLSFPVKIEEARAGAASGF